MKLIVGKTILLHLFIFVSFVSLPLESYAQNYGRIQSADPILQRAMEESKEKEAVQGNSIEQMESIEEYQNFLNLMSGDFQEGSSTYTLGVNDVIEISVMRHPEVSGQYVINSEGKIQYEFVGDIEISGLLKEEAKEVIRDRLSTYIVAPDVTITILGYNSKVVYVYGEVGRPGKIFMKGDTITVREALLQAGLPLLNASIKKCPLITPSADGKIAKKNINVHALLYEGNLRENLVMKPGDTLYVPPTFISKTLRSISPVTGAIGTAAGTGRTLRGF